MKLKKVLVILFCLAIGFAFAACAGEETKSEFGSLYDEAKTGFEDSLGELSGGNVGDTLSNSFFDWTLNSVDTADQLNGKKPKDGYKFVVANISVKNKVDYAYETGNYDFIGIIDVSEEGQLDTMDSFYDDMYPDSTELAAGKTVKGDLVFQVKADVTELLIDYQEVYDGGETGNTNWFCIKL